MPEVLLVPMDRDRYDTFICDVIGRYAREIEEAGYADRESALEKSTSDTLGVVPRGFDTPAHHFYVIKDLETMEELGELWIKLEEEPRRSVFIYSLFLREEHRGKGYGKATMARLDDLARRLGAEAINLHVFGLNERAIRLYRSCGYVVRSMNMGKELGSSR